MILLYAARRVELPEALMVARITVLENIVDGESIHVREGLAGYADFKEVVIDSIYSVTIPPHETLESRLLNSPGRHQPRSGMYERDPAKLIGGAEVAAKPLALSPFF